MCAWQLNPGRGKSWKGTRMDTLKPGARFRCMTGTTWRYVRPHHYTGVFTCEALEDSEHYKTGALDHWPGCAEVDLLEEIKT